ncbi:hypothetical protein Ancab_039751 [Ancistrocladus abbreviatus]
MSWSLNSPNLICDTTLGAQSEHEQLLDTIGSSWYIASSIVCAVLLSASVDWAKSTKLSLLDGLQGYAACRLGLARPGGGSGCWKLVIVFWSSNALLKFLIAFPYYFSLSQYQTYISLSLIWNSFYCLFLPWL